MDEMFLSNHVVGLLVAAIVIIRAYTYSAYVRVYVSIILNS